MMRSFPLPIRHSNRLPQTVQLQGVSPISYGDVYKTNDQILTVEGSNIYEAYIVVSSGKLVGFYLPVEQSYSPLSDSKDLYFEKIIHNP